MTVEIGVVAFRIAASPEAMWLWPHTTRQNGTTLLSRPMAKNARQARPSAGVSLSSTFRINAANPTRSNTMVNGGKVLIRTPAKKNEPPHRTDSSSSRASHSLPFMRWLIEVVSVIRFAAPPRPPIRNDGSVMRSPACNGNAPPDFRQAPPNPLVKGQTSHGEDHHRNPLAGSQPHQDRAQCAGRRDELEGCDRGRARNRGQRHPRPRLGQGATSHRERR